MTNSAIITGDTAALSSARAQHIKPFAEVARGLLEMGYSPIPQQGQACRIPGWPQYAQTPIAADDIARFAGSPIPYDIGIALWYRRVVAVDRDTDDPDVVAALRPVFRCIYARGGVPVAKIGSKGATSFFRFDGDAFTRLTYRSSIAVFQVAQVRHSPESIAPMPERADAWARAWRAVLDVDNSRVVKVRIDAILVGRTEKIDSASCGESGSACGGCDGGQTPKILVKHVTPGL